jgi:RND family efflux transporter MFP subunit
MVFGVCRRILSDAHDAEAAFQAVFLALARKAGVIGQRAALAGWLYRVACRVSLNARADRARRAARERPAPSLGDVPAPAETSPSEGREVQALVDEEVGRLPERLRLAVILCYLEGRTVEEAARQLGCPRGTVASRLARARQRLSARLVRRGLSVAATAVGALCRPAYGAPRTLIRVAARAAAEYAKAAGGAAVPTRAALLAGEVLKAMFIRKVKMTAAALVALAGVLLAGGLALRSQAGAAPAAAGAEGKAPAPAAQAVRVTVSKPLRRELAPFVDFTGRLEALRGVEVRPRVGGRVAKIHVRDGDVVKKGDVLLEIDPTSYQLELTQAETDLARADLQRKLAARDLRKLVEALDKGQKIAPAERDVLRANAAVAEADYKLAQVKADAARLALESTRVLAPAGGKVGRLGVVEGDRVPTSGEGSLLTTLSPSDEIGLRFNMDERSFLDYQKLQKVGTVKGVGASLSVGLVGDKGFPRTATLKSFDDQLSPNTGTVGVRGVLPNPDGRLRPGMFVRVRVPFGKPRPVLLVPDDAVSSDQGKRYLLLVNARNVVERRDVKLGEGLDSLRVIAEGLRPDEWVIVSGLQRVRPGIRVEPKRQEAPRGPGR